MILTTHHEKYRKFNRLSKNSLLERNKRVKTRFFALVWNDAGLLSRVGRQDIMFRL